MGIITNYVIALSQLDFLIIQKHLGEMRGRSRVQFSHFRVQLYQNYTQKHVITCILHKMLIDIST